MLFLPPSALGRVAPTARLEGIEALSAHLNRATWAASGRRRFLSFSTPMLKSFVGLSVLQFSISYCLAHHQY